MSVEHRVVRLAASNNSSLRTSHAKEGMCALCIENKAQSHGEQHAHAGRE